MRKLTILSMITLDGVMQAPGGKNEDPSGGFEYGGWTAPYGDDIGMKTVQEELSQNVEYLLGRKTFDIWERYWPNHADFWPGINHHQKYVLTSTREKTDWQHTTFLRTLQDIQTLKASPGPDLHVWGSSQLIQLLLQNDLVDELRLKIHPLTLGQGKKLFADGTLPTAFKLIDSQVTHTGVILAHYQRAGDVETGEVTPSSSPEGGEQK